MRIIIGVDESLHSAAAVEFVSRMQWPKGSSALVITAVPPIHIVVPEAAMMMAEQTEGVRRELLAQGARHTRAVATELAAAGLKADGRAMDGDPRDVLVEACRAEHADMIVLGSHGRTGLAKMLMGSVAAHVVTHAPCSVLIVRRPPAA